MAYNQPFQRGDKVTVSSSLNPEMFGGFIGKTCKIVGSGELIGWYIVENDKRQWCEIEDVHLTKVAR